MATSNVENLKNFEERIKRIEGAKRKSGRVGRSSSGEYFRKEEERRKRGRKGKRGNWTLRILLVAAAFLGTKTYIIFNMGPEAYESRMAELNAGDQYQKVAAMALQADPITTKLQEFLIESGVLEPRPASDAVITDLEGLKVQVADPAEGETAEPVAPESEEAGTTSAVPASQSAAADSAAN